MDLPESGKETRSASPTIPKATADKLSTIVLDKAVTAITEEVDRHNRFEGFLKAAVAQLAAYAVEFVESVGVASVRAAAARKGATAINKGDVMQGYERTAGRKAERQAWYLCLVGILAGGAIASAVAVAITPRTTTKTCGPVSLWVLAWLHLWCSL